MALFFPSFGLFEPRVRRINPMACHLLPHRPRCQPFNPLAHIMAPWNLFEEADLLDVKNEGGCFEIDLNLSGFDASNLKINVHPETRVLTVTGEKEEKSEDGSLVSAKHFQRSFVVPEDCSLDKITSSFSEGKLAIKAPKGQPQVEHQKEETPAVVHHEEAQQQQDVPEQVEVSVDVHQPKEDAKENMEVEEPSPAPKAMEIVSKEVSKENTQPMNTDSNNLSNGFEFTINMKGFNPDNMEVVVDDSGFVQVSAKQKEELEDGSISAREIKKKVAVDATKFDLDEISSHLNDDGIMVISVPEKTSSRQVVINRN